MTKLPKHKRKDGWTYPNTTIKAKKKDIINECLEPQPFWDDWNDWRDGMREWMTDRSRKRPPKEGFGHKDRIISDNNKLIKKEKIRQAQKDMEKIKKVGDIKCVKNATKWWKSLKRK